MIVLVPEDEDHDSPSSAPANIDVDPPSRPSESTTTTTTWADQSASPLLALPAELRNRIWTLLLVQTPHRLSPRPLSAPPSSSSPSPAPHFSTNNNTGQQQQQLHVAALRTCHQIHHEAQPILYGGNVFEAHPSLLTALPRFRLDNNYNISNLTSSLGSYYNSYNSNSSTAFTHITTDSVARLIRHFRLAVRLDTDPRFTARQAADAFTGIHGLEIVVSQAMFGGCDLQVLRLFEGVRGVGKARVRGSVGDGRYAAWLARIMMLPPGTLAEPFIELQA